MDVVSPIESRVPAKYCLLLLTQSKRLPNGLHCHSFVDSAKVYAIPGTVQ